MTNWTTVKIPETPTANLIIVTNISASASEKTNSAAKTACMLTNAMIVDSQIVVKPYFEEADSGDSQEAKPKATILAEILAAGYQLQDTIIEKGLEIDAKYGVANKINAYVEAAKAQAQALDEKYKVTEKASELDNKYHVQERVNAAVGQGIGYSNQALQTAPAQKVAGVAVHVKEQIAAVHHEARRIADEKKAKAVGAPEEVPEATPEQTA
ncbi:hypothetical protein BGZ46_005085 [Entomortierella lignicola]|nr:hypothetical protein BGZ46_005085 [Entomortierella lignicola]